MGVLTVGQAIYIGFAGFFLFNSVISNFAIIWVVIKFKEMYTPTNIFISNLALSDIVMGGVILPQMLHDISHTGEFHEGEFSCRFVTALPLMCITTSIYSLVVMAVERYRAICTKKGAMSKLMAKKISGVVWIVAFLISLPTMMEYAVFREYFEVPENATQAESNLRYDGKWVNYTRVCGNTIGWTYGFVNGLFIFLFSYFVPLFIIFICYTHVGLFIHRQAKKQEETAGADNKAGFTLLKNKVRVLKMLVVVATLFAVSWMPYFVLLLIAKATGKDGTDEAAGAVNLVRLSLSVFSVSYNVYLYLYFTPSFRTAFKKLAPFCFPPKVDPSEETSSAANTNSTNAPAD